MARKTRSNKRKPGSTRKPKISPKQQRLLRRRVRKKQRAIDRLRSIDDFRRYVPDKIIRYHKVSGVISPIILSDSQKDRKKGQRQTKARIAFADPKRTIVCQKRRERREMLFKAGKIGKGTPGPKFRKYRPESQISCRRR